MKKNLLLCIFTSGLLLLAAVFRLPTASAACPDGGIGNDNIICSGSNDLDGVNTGIGDDTVTTAAVNGNIDNSTGFGILFGNTGTVQGDGSVIGLVGVATANGSVTNSGSGGILGGTYGIFATGYVYNTGSGDVNGFTDTGIHADIAVYNTGSGDVSGTLVGISASISASISVTNSGSGNVSGGTTGISAAGDITNSGSGNVSGGNTAILGSFVGQTITLLDGTITGGTAVDAAGGSDTVIVAVGSVTVNGNLDGNSGTDMLELNGTTDDAAGWNFFQSCVTTPAACSGVGPFNVTANGKTFTFSNFEAFLNNMSLIVAAADGQPISVDIGSGSPASPASSGPNEVCSGAIKVFRQPNGDLDVYSGFDALPPNGFLVGRITAGELAAGVLRFQDIGTAAQLGWVAEVTLSDKLIIQVFDGQGNPIGTCQP